MRNLLGTPQGGGLESGETFEQAAWREAGEELEFVATSRARNGSSPGTRYKSSGQQTGVPLNARTAYASCVTDIGLESRCTFPEDGQISPKTANTDVGTLRSTLALFASKVLMHGPHVPHPHRSYAA